MGLKPSSEINNTSATRRLTLFKPPSQLLEYLFKTVMNLARREMFTVCVIKNLSGKLFRSINI